MEHTDIKWSMSIDEIYDKLMNDPTFDNDCRKVICEYEYDDEDKKWWISAYRNGKDSIDIVFDTANSTDTVNCASQPSVCNAVNAFLSRAKELTC